jgi:hypothetical protein
MPVSNLEMKQKKVELLRVSAAKAELELRIETMLEEVERVRGAVKIQEDKEEELRKLIEELGKKAV